ncbi:MAG: DUF1501 domain-containing protein [Planctomycetota bacterium]|nr:DUF1501 domain-containing protein [Planctomycetota bacterium]
MNHPLLHQTRRHFFQDCSIGLGGMALSTILAKESAASDEIKIDRVQPLLPRRSHFTAKAKNVIFLHMAGSPPHLDLFDYKPELVKRTDEPCPEEFFKGKQFAFTNGRPKLLGTPHQFKQYGENGTWFSDAIPKLAELADDLCVVKSMHTDQFNHAPAQLMLYTGSPRVGRPSMGSWVTYGLGTENQDLPGFVVLLSGGLNPSAGNTAWGSGFLPSVFQGVQCRSKGDPVLYASNPKGMDANLRRLSLDAINGLNKMQAEQFGNAETLTRIAQYELAFRMQAAVPEVMDISKESEKTISAYGAKPGAASFANNCLLARRLVESGVRYVQLFDWGWDFHGTNPSEDIGAGLSNRCKPMDQAVSMLIKDLKNRNLLDETLVVWSGEFGRTPFREGRTAKGKVLGRDHYPDCYTMFMAGGGVKPGISYGESDPLGFSVTRDKVHVHDLQATILHLLGFDHEQLTHFYQGRNFRLTDVHGNVVQDLLA